MSVYEAPAVWGALPDAPTAWMHSGAAVVAGRVLVAHPSAPVLLFLGTDGRLEREVRVEGLIELHGLDAAAEGLWIADIGSKWRARGGEVEDETGPGRVVLVDDSGAIVRELADPGERWKPTGVAAVAETGEVWVADGYRHSLVHRFAADGRHVQTLTGLEGAGRFDCPHGLLVDRRRGEPELYVADRANARLQVYDLEGRYLRTAGEGVVATPTDLVAVGDALALTDFTQARVTILDGDDRLAEHVGADPGARERDAWPNARDDVGNLVPPPPAPGRFNSPHAIAADADGNLYVTEWLLGGRVSRVPRQRRMV